MRPSMVAIVKDRVTSDTFQCEDVLELDYDAESEEWEKGEVCKDDGVGSNWMVGTGENSQETGIGVLQESNTDIGGTQGWRKLPELVDRHQKNDVSLSACKKDW
ncbi:hypothetical protein NDU88_005682 [Pleurodeles waltl]|uniref:Uncharacterized protein n=1 Tax=Pleurodeles waltl TaxID=8319 RepID=A0AAV7RPP6_PLEWA|nr:hypothetical protein NDU88_005682 [Pleurodeles waltl]